MGLGTALLQPQVTARAAPDSIAALFEDAQRLAAILAEDAASNGPLAGEIEAAFQAALPRLQSRIEPRLDAARTRLRPWLDGLRAFVDGLADSASEAEGDPAAIPRMAAQVLGQLRDLLAALTLPGIRQQLERARALIEDDLGLGPAALLGHVTDFLDDLAARFVDAHEGEDADIRRRRRLAANVTAAMRLRLDDITLPSADVELWARAIFRALRGSGIADALAQLDCAAEALEKAATAAAAAAEAARPQAQPVGAGIVPMKKAPEYSWYASWLLKEEDVPLLGLSDIKQKQGLINRFRVPQNNIDRHILDAWFTTPERETLETADLTPGEDPPEDLMLMVLAILNREMQKGAILPDLPGEGLIAEGLLTDEIKDLRSNYRDRQALLEYNRRVIERAYPSQIDEYTSKHARRFYRHFVKPIFGRLGAVWHEVQVTGDGKFVMCDDKPIHMGTECKWHDAPIFTEVRHGLWFDFDRVSADKLELTAQILLTAANFAKPIWHAIEVQPGHEAQAGLFSGLEFAEALQQSLFGKPLSAHFQLLGSGAHGAGIWLDCAAGWRGISLILTSLQGVVGRDDNDLGAYWLTTFMGDAIRTEKAIGYVNILPDVVLTFITLINSGRTPWGHSHSLPSGTSANHRIQDGITKNVDRLFELWLHSVYARDNYSIFLWADDGIGDRRTEAMAGHWFGASFGIALLSGLTGTLFVQITAWVEEWDRLGLTMKDSFLRFFFQYWIKNYLLNENDTDDGRYRPGGGNYRGYPDRDVAPSPYRLPMPGGTARYMGQGNQGLFSHNFITNTDFVTPANSANLQTYAYDFSHEFQQPISCVRDGTVWNPPLAGGGAAPFNENNLDSNTANANTLTIRHNTVDAEHDVLGGAPIQTYTVYVHLAQNGITNAPFWAVNPLAHGAPVAQGDLIALAGDTGMSFHNHLHLHVLADDGTGNPGNRTVPFVFDDVDSNDGVMRSITWYRSGNT